MTSLSIFVLSHDRDLLAAVPSRPALRRVDLCDARAARSSSRRTTSPSRASSSARSRSTSRPTTSVCSPHGTTRSSCGRGRLTLDELAQGAITPYLTPRRVFAPAITGAERRMGRALRGDPPGHHGARPRGGGADPGRRPLPSDGVREQLRRAPRRVPRVRRRVPRVVRDVPRPLRPRVPARVPVLDLRHDARGRQRSLPAATATRRTCWSASPRSTSRDRSSRSWGCNGTAS